MENKNQHWVPVSYLKAWIDPTLPVGRRGQTWVYTKNGDSHETKSPKKIFFEEELYTGQTVEGKRDISIENKFLHSLENNFLKVRLKLCTHKDLTPKEFEHFLFFIAAMLNRTKEQNLFFKRQWETWEKNSATTFNQIKQQANISQDSLITPDSNTDELLTPANFSKLAKAPLYHMLRGLTQVTASQLFQMNFNILTTTNSPGFITSDNPCVLFDPDISSRPPLYQVRGLCYPRIEITLPISPQMLIHFHKNKDELGNNQFIPITDDGVDSLNRNTRYYCTNHFIVNKEMTKQIWFEDHP